MNYELAAAALLAPNCSGANKLALQGFALLAEENGICIVSPAAIAKTIGVNRSTICRAIETLKEVGYLADADNGYKVTVPALSESNQDVARCNKSVASRNNDGVAVCNNVASRNKIEGLDVARCNKSVASRNNPPAENPPQKSASLPPTPPITSNNIFITPPILDSTQTKENISRVEDNNNRTTSDNIYTTDKVATPDNVKPTAEDSSLTLEARQDAFRREAISELIQKGFTESDAASRVNAVWDEFIKTASDVKKNGFKGINQKRPYFIGMLVNKAVEGPKKKKQPEQPEPKDLYDIIDFIKSQTLDECKEKFGKLGAFEEADVRNIFDTDMLARQRHNIWLRLLEKQELGWYGETSAVACVRKMLGLDHLVRQVMAKIDAERYADAKRKIAKMEMRLPSLEKQVEGLTRPKDNEPGSGYILSFFRDLEKYRRELPRLREFVANWEAQHNK